MKKLSVCALFAGVLLILLSVFSIRWIAENGLSQSYADRMALALQVLGGVTVFWGLIGLVFSRKLSKWCSPKSILLAVAIALTVGVGVYAGLALLSCFFLSSPVRHPIRFPVSCCLGCLCFGGFIGLMYIYCKYRAKEKSTPGTVLDVLLGLSYCVPFFLLCSAMSNIASYFV